MKRHAISSFNQQILTLNLKTDVRDQLTIPGKLIYQEKQKRLQQCSLQEIMVLGFITRLQLLKDTTLRWINHYPLDNSIGFNKQLLDEVEHDIINYQNRGLCYLPKPKAKDPNPVV